MVLVIDLTAAREQIEPYEQLLIDGANAGVKKWEEMLMERPDFARPLGTTARANYIHPHVCNEITQRITGVEGIEATDALDFFAVKIGPEILMRVKYLRQGRPNNIKTKQQKLLAKQQYTPEMVMALTGDPALTPPTLLTLGYTLDGAQIGRIEVRCDCRRKLPWNYDIYGGTAVVEPIILDGMADETRPAIVISARKKEAESENAAEQK